MAAGVYVIWDDQTLLYVGTAGKDLDKAQKSGKNKFGLITRLNSMRAEERQVISFVVFYQIE